MPSERVPPERVPPERVPPERVPPERVPPPPPPVRVPPESEAKREAKRQEFAGSTGWQQGFVIWALKPPYASRADVASFHYKNPPPGFIKVKGGPEAAFRSIQTMTGKAPEKLRIDLGFEDILIQGPKRKPGAPGAIGFKQDIEQKTTGDITITSTGSGKPRVTKGVAEEPLAINPLQSSKMPAEIAERIGSISAKIVNGKPVIKVKRL